jgi:DNA polymerase III epsilon subunit family exonuclease
MEHASQGNLLSSLHLPPELAETEFAVVDVETTGLEPDWGHRVCEVGVIVWRNGSEIERFTALVNPEREIEPAAALINRLTSEMLADAPLMADILPSLRTLLDGRVLVAYNASFDVGFLRKEFRLAGQELPISRIVDVMALAKRLMPNLGRYPLYRVVKACGIAFPLQHRAMADVEATSSLLFRFLEQIMREGVSTVRQLEEITRPSSPVAESLRQDKLRIIQAALTGKNRLHLIYRARDLAFSERDVTPLEVRTYAGEAQLIGYCHLRQSERTFVLDSIQDVQIVP